MGLLFSPIAIGTLELKNRLVMPAMHLHFCPDGFVNDRLIRFYVERAKGEVGLIIVGGCGVDEFSYSGMIKINDDCYLPGLTRLATEVKRHGARIVAQLFQAGRYASSRDTGRQPVAPSPIPSKLTRETPRELTLTEIEDIIDRFAQAARRAQAAGFDGVEVIASAGYLICQFLSPVTNKRTDEFGGDLTGRMKFGLEVARRIKLATGPDYPLIYRVSGHEFMPGGNTNQEIRVFCQELEKVGVNAINVTGGWHETTVPQITMNLPRGGFVYLAQGIKEAVGIPVVACNRINDPVLAEQILIDGQADLIGIARGLIADPELPRKARQGRLREIRKCIGCNQGCLDAIFAQQSVHCLVNAQAGKEEERTLKAANQGKRVLVIGGGPAGMEAARVAALRGHQVTLWEQANVLGGQLVLAAVPPGRAEFTSLVDFLVGQLERLGVEVVLGQSADPKKVVSFRPDVVVVATGAKPLVPEWLSGNHEHVVTAWEVLSGQVPVGRRVVVIGGGAVGCETALYLAQKGTIDPAAFHFLAMNRAESWETLMLLATRGNKQVTVIEMGKALGLDIGSSTRWTVLQDLHRYHVRVLTNTRAEALTPGGVKIRRGDVVEELAADTVVLAVGAQAENALFARLQTLVPEVYLIGDAVKPRKALEAIHEGFLIGQQI
ncbi:MAG: FAD-dependent oxidoreductase [Firmicutes bacterium]|nr:FAD-dependent oxidoreductase [Bacillota bacterium]